MAGLIDIAKKFIERVNESHTPQYKRLKIIFKMASPVALSHPWLHFDGLIFHLHLMHILGQDFFLLWEAKTPFSVVIRQAMRSGVWMDKGKARPVRIERALPFASVSFFDKENIKITKLYKRFEDRFVPKWKKKKVYRGSGYFKDYMLSQVYIACSEVVFYADADELWMEKLLPHVTGLGDNVRIGFGAVKDFSIEPTDVHPVIHGGKAMRPIPRHLLDRASDVAYLAWKSPYWYVKNVAPCAVPGSEVEARWIENGEKPS